MFLTIPPIVAAFFLCVLFETVHDVGCANQSKFTLEEKMSMIKNLMEVKQNVPISHLLMRLINSSDTLEKANILPANPHVWAKEILDLLQNDTFNPFHNVSNDDIYGGNRDQLEMLLDIIETVSDNLIKYDALYHANATNKNETCSTIPSGKDKSVNETNCDMKKTIQHIRYTAKKFINTHEKENRYWTNGLVKKHLERVSEGFNHASTPALITNAIEKFLAKIATRDQFVIAVSNLCLWHSHTDAISQKMGIYTVVVMRSTAVNRKLYQWVKMEEDISSMNLLFNCNEKWYRQDDQRTFETGISAIRASGAAMFCNCDAYENSEVQTSVVNVNKAGNKNTPGWSIKGSEYVNYFKSDQLKALVMSSFNNSLLVLCF